ncbi:MAG: hypothetical protein K8I00_00855 [Candidatus Omnitrophica bacterium]|nr:hypothetical protein [Candidatus Omnitrophota bacterium]
MKPIHLSLFRYLRSLPAYQVVRLVHVRNWRSYMLMLIVVFMCAVQFSKLYSPRVQRVFMRQFHLKEDHFLRWACLQAVPTMYSFANELWWSPVPVGESDLFLVNTDITERYYVWLNHFPLHFITYNHYRDLHFKDKEPRYLHLRTRFRGQDVSSDFVLTAE